MLAGDTTTMSRGIAAPTEKVAADVRAACTGRAVVISDIPNSSRASPPRRLSPSAARRLAMQRCDLHHASHRFGQVPRVRPLEFQRALYARAQGPLARCRISELTETYSPAAIDMAPATKPATPAIITSFCVAAAAATPTIKLAVETMPSLAPSTAALSHPIRSTR